MLSTDSILTDADNPNRMTKTQKMALQSSITQYGMASDIWVCPAGEKHPGKYRIIDGEHRYTALRELGASKVSCRIFALPTGHSTNASLRVLRQVANKLRGKHDGRADSEDLKEIFEAGSLDVLAKQTGTNVDVYKNILDRSGYLPYNEKKKMVDAAASKVIGPSNKGARKIPKRVKGQGEIWELGVHRLMCGDSTSAKDKDALLGDDSVHCIITDPPYGVDVTDATRRRNVARGQHHVEAQEIENDDKMSAAEFVDFLTAALTNNHIATHCSAYVWMADYRMYELLQAFERAGIRLYQTLIWTKASPVLSRLDYLSQHESCLYGYYNKTHKFYGDRNNFTTLGGPRRVEPADRWHLTQKPIEVLRMFARNSTQPDGIIFDPFGGSGSTAIAAEQADRASRIMELSPEWCDTIIEHWQTTTGGKAVCVQKKER